VLLRLLVIDSVNLRVDEKIDHEHDYDWEVGKSMLSKFWRRKLDSTQWR
jgi:hypothetical protein